MTNPRVRFVPPLLVATAVALVLVNASRATFSAEDLSSDAARQRVDKLVRLLEKKDGDGFWSLVVRIEHLGKSAVPALVARLDSANEKTRLGCAKALLTLGGESARDKATSTLGELAQNAKQRTVRIDAIQVYGLGSDDDDLDVVIEKLESLLESETDPGALIALCRTLWELDNLQSARDKLLSLLASRDPTVRQEAALTLAEGGQYENPTVKNVLRSLKKEPTTRGRRAEILYRLMKLETQLDDRLYRGEFVPRGTDAEKLLAKREGRIRDLEKQVRKLENRPARSSRPGTAAARDTPEDLLLEEVLAKIGKLYVDGDKTSRERLLTNAVKGMVHSLDEHSVFMEAEQTKDFNQDIRGEYPGIGAHISKRPDGPLEILRPIYGGPTHRAGLLSGDLIIEIDGRPTPTLKLDELKDLLRGPRGTTVTLKILRRGWNDPRDFQLARDKIALNSVFYESLPERLGYLKLTQFGARSADEFREALDKLEAKGLDGLIIDLRNNPGGYLPVAEKIADLFVNGDLPIVTQKGRDGDGEQTTMPTPQARSGYAIVILVNGNSASASEVVSGCLQDHRRATLVGQRTFGKGSVQRLIPVESVLGCTLKLTAQYWYLPLGRCINTLRDEKGRVLEKGGVVPDIEVERELLATWRLEERATLRTNEKIAEYVETHFQKLRELVPLGDRNDESRYPNLTELHASLDTHALRADVRQVLRYHTRRKLEDERGREFAFDLQEDNQLQRALAHLLEVVGRDAAESDTWRWLAGNEPQKPRPGGDPDAE